MDSFWPAPGAACGCSPSGTKGSREIPRLTCRRNSRELFPGGHLLAYTSNQSGRFEVYVETVPRSDKRWPVSTNGGYEPRWRADGGEIYYLSEDRNLMAVPVAAGFKFGIPKPLFQAHVPVGVSGLRTHYVPSRDSDRFLVNVATDTVASPITVVLNWPALLNK